MSAQYRDGYNASVGPKDNAQVYMSYLERKSLEDRLPDMYFSRLASSKDMPKHYGKELEMFHVFPIIDERNDNDEGLDANGAYYAGGNLWGSSKDIGFVEGRMPNLQETNGEYNRVGMTRERVKGRIDLYGIYMTYTRELLDFDNDMELYGHYVEELTKASTKIYEDRLQIDLLNSAGVVYYTGEATSVDTITPEGANPSTISFRDLQRLSRQLDNNNSPRTTKIIDGINKDDTRVVGAGRMAFIGSELEIQITEMQDGFGNPAFVPVESYAHKNDYLKGTDFTSGEIGKVGNFRIVVAPTMLSHVGGGAETADADVANQYLNDDNNYTVCPFLVVGDSAFATVGLMGAPSAKGKKFQIMSMKPGQEALSMQNPFGLEGLISIQWYYGYICLRPERIAVIWSAALA